MSSPGAVVHPPIPVALKAVPFFLSATLFFSGFFALFAPLPLLILALRSERSASVQRMWLWLATLTNGLLLWFLAGPVSITAYAILIVPIALLLPEFLQRRYSLTRVVGLTLLSILVVTLTGVGVYSWIKQVNPVLEIQTQLGAGLNVLFESLSEEARKSLLGTGDPIEVADVQRAVIQELPSALGILALAMVWTNLLLVLRMNVGRIRERLGLDQGFFVRWRAPEWLVWPTIAAGGLLIFDFGGAAGMAGVAVAALNVFKFLMAIYAIQGLSVLSYFFESWGIRGMFRSLGYVIALMALLPLLLGLGFFDLWFDFRRKLRQS